jgi:membrane-bound serine protease (ClpP class)
MGSKSVSSLSFHLTHLSPNAAVLVLTFGIALIYVELNRPGSILPGAFGLLATLLSIASISQRHPSPNGILLILSAVSLLLVDLLRPTHILVAVAATIALILGFRGLLVPSCCPSISFPVSFGCGLLLGAGTSTLTRIARRARVNKGLD